MLRIGLSSLLAFACCTAIALAAGRDEFSRGIAANNNGNDDLAVSSFTAALNDGDLDASLIPVAYFGRATAYINKRECALALADATAALKLKPDYPDAIEAKGSAEICVRDEQAAIADFTRFAALRPSAFAYRTLGLLHWNTGDFTSAAVDFSQAAKLTDKPVYDVLWHELSLLRAGAFDADEEAAAVASLDLRNWPGPVFNLYAGRATFTDIESAAEAKDAQTAAKQKCEASFYMAQSWVAQRNPAKAKPLLDAARSDCPHDIVEYGEAAVELNRLKSWIVHISPSSMHARGLPNFP